MEPLESLQFGSYEVMRRADGSHWLLGEGGFGRTYKARHRFLRRICALKIIHERHMRDGRQRARFLQEARTAARLVHPGIAEVYDFGEADGAVFYVMEFCEGGTLEDFSRRCGAMPWSEVAGLGRQMAAALACAHGAGMLHRDLKPQNVMLASTAGPPALKLIDFGLVKVIARSSGDSTMAVMSRDGGFKGNYATASPEQTAESDQLDERSDLFSLGVILWWLLLGKSPFAGMSHPRMIADRLSDESYAPRLDAEVDPEARAILGRMLEKDPAARISSAHEVLAALPGSAESAPIAIGQAAARPAAAPAGRGEPAGKSFEDSFEVLSTLDDLQAAKLYHCRDGEGRSYSALIPKENAAQDSIESLGRLAEQRRKLGCLECYGQWPSGEGGPAFVFGDMGRIRLLDALKKLGGARLVEIAPMLHHLACSIEHCGDVYGVCLELNPHMLRISGADPADAPGSWQRLAPDSLRAVPRVACGIGGAELAADSTIVSSDIGFPMVAQFAGLIYRLVAANPVRHAAYFTGDAYVPAAPLSEDGNLLLSRIISGQNPDLPTTELLRQLVTVEGMTSGALGPAPVFGEAAELPPVPGRSPEVRSGRKAPPPDPVRVGAAEVGAAEVGAVEVGAAEVGAVEVGAVEVGAVEVGAVEVGAAGPSRLPQVCETPVPAAAAGGSRGRPVRVALIIAVAGACVGLLAWQLPGLLSRDNGGGSGVDSGTAGAADGDGGVVVPAGSEPVAGVEQAVTLEFPRVTTNQTAIPEDAEFVLRDSRGTPVARFGITGTAVSCDGVPAELFSQPGRWPLSLLLDSPALSMTAATFEWDEFEKVGDGRRRYTKSLHLDPRPFLLADPVVKVDGRPVELPLALMKRHLHPADPAVDWTLREQDGKLAVSLAPGRSFPLQAVFDPPCIEPVRFELSPGEQPVWNLEARQRTVNFSGLGDFQQLRFLPDLESIDEPGLRGIVQLIAGEQASGGEGFEKGAGSWALAALDGEIEVSTAGGQWRFPLAAATKYRVLTEADRAGRAPVAGDPGLLARKKLAEQGDIDAQFRLALMYLDDEGGVKNEQASTGWFRVAATRGDKAAQYNLGLAYENGTGVGADPHEAARWFSKAAAQQHAQAQTSLGLCYQDGRGVGRDPDLAERWFLEAVNQGHPGAMFNLAVLYGDKDAGKLDEKRAVELYQMAAGRGHPAAQYNLAWHYRYGEGGLPQDIGKAIELYQQASDNGFAEAGRALEELRARHPAPQ